MINTLRINSHVRFAILAVALCSSTIGLTACGLSDTLRSDRDAGLDKQDYRDAMASRLDDESAEADAKKARASIPALQPYVGGQVEEVSSMPLVSISVNQSVPLRDVLFELAQQANVDIELDPRITGSVIFTARERPLDQVIERLSAMAGLRYNLEGDFLRVELDTPYNKTYKIDYLSYVRSNKSSIRNEVGVVSADEGSTDTGSGFATEAESEANFWAELEGNLTQVLSASYSSLRTAQDPRITVLEQPANVAPVGVEKGAVAAPNAVLRVDALPPAVAEAGDEEEAPSFFPPSTFVVNKQAGIVNVFAPEKVQKEVSDYLTLLRRSVTSQVLIEAKILEVELNDNFALGIDWRAVELFDDRFGLNYFSSNGLNLLNSIVESEFVPGVDAAIGSVNELPFGAQSTSSVFAAGYSSGDVQALVRAVSEYGNVRALASPRMTVLNNQSAVLNVATNQVFFEIDIDVTTDEGVTQTDIDSTIRNVPEGVLVNVQPSIDLDNNTIALALRPTITRVVNVELDPAVQFVTADAGITGVENAIPELNVQEIDSVIQVRSGQPIVMGGLLQDRVVSIEDGVPVLSDVPVLGAAFRQHNDQVSKTELVIFLKATILDNPADSIHNTDRELYKKFSGDRRPFRL